MTFETAKYLVQRAGSQFYCTGANLADTLTDGDLVAVTRPGVDTFKWIVTKTPSNLILNIDTGGDTQFSLSSQSGVNVKGTIDWGDGNVYTMDGSSILQETHVYSTPGVYTVTIAAVSPFSLYGGDTASQQKVEGLSVDDDFDWGSSLNLSFQNMSMTTFPTLPNTNTVTDFTSAWTDAAFITSFPLLDYSLGDSFQYTWRGCSSMTTWGDGSTVDFPEATGMFMTWFGCSQLTSFPVITIPKIENLSYTWNGCSSLTSFPIIDTSNATSCDATWQGCSGLTTFPGVDLSSSTSASYTWADCTLLESFASIPNLSNCQNFSFIFKNCTNLQQIPDINTSNGNTFQEACTACATITSFPALDFSQMTTFFETWKDCTNLADFPANMFDTTGTLEVLAFASSFTSCALTAVSIENILVSLDTNGQAPSGATLSINGGTNASKTTWSVAANTAYTNLIGKGWNIVYNA